MASEQKPTAKGLTFSRKYTRDDLNVFDQFEYDYRTSVIRNPSGEVVFEMNNVEVPKQRSQIATDILAQKYFRKAGVPQADGSTGMFFKYGSGVGTNYSNIRGEGEKLSGGGTSSGLMSFLKIGDCVTIRSVIAENNTNRFPFIKQIFAQISTQHLHTHVYISGLFFSTCKSTFV